MIQRLEKLRLAPPAALVLLLALGASYGTARAAESDHSADRRAAASQVLASDDFETIRDRRVTGLPGWSATGAVDARTSDAEAASGRRSLVVPQGAPESFLSRSTLLSPDGITFIDLRIRPMADASNTPTAQLDLCGALVGFVRQDEEGLVVTVAGTGGDAPSTSVTGFSFPIEANGRSSHWLRVTVRLDTNSRRWDLFLDGLPAGFDLPLTPSAFPAEQAKPANITMSAQPPKTGSLDVYASLSGKTAIDDLRVTTSNPLFLDDDKDAIPDAVSEVAEYEYRRSKSAAGANGRSTALLAFSRSFQMSSDGGSSGGAFIFVDNEAGSDSHAGRLSYRTGPDGPKRTVRSAQVACRKDGSMTIVLMPSKSPHLFPNYPRGRAPNVNYFLMEGASIASESNL